MKLNEKSYDKEKWSISESRETGGYTFVNKEDYGCYNVHGNIIGINQIDENIFLVYRRNLRDEWEICRYRLERKETLLEYGHRFQKYDFLTEDKIIFEADNSVFATVYSISQNKELKEIQRIISPKYSDANFCKSRKINFVKNEEDEYPKYLEVIYKIGGLYCQEYLQMLVNPETFEVISEIYSTMRGKFFKVTEEFTLLNLFEEENNYANEVDKYLQDIYEANNTKDITEMLEHLNKEES